MANWNDDRNEANRTAGTTTGTGVLEHEHTDANRDPLSGAPGAHPVGTGVGAVGGGAAGVAIGTAVGGPVGAVVGGAIGAVVGGLAGKGIAESIDPTAEDAYWRENYGSRGYVQPGSRYEDYQPAYRYGWESRAQHADRAWDQAENDLQRGWENVKGESKLKWEQAKDATRDAWNRVDTNLRSDDDSYWRQNYNTKSYVDRNRPYEDYQPAYRYGWESRNRYAGRQFEDVENDLERGWEHAKGRTNMAWADAKHAVKDAWHRVERALPGDADLDGR